MNSADPLTEPIPANTLDPKTIKELRNLANSYKQLVDSKQGKIYLELPIFDPNSHTVGTVDMIYVANNGDASIIDFKTPGT